MKSKSLQAAKMGKAKGASAKPFFVKKGSKEANGAFFSVPTQPSLRVGKPDSPYEKEADAMADTVTGKAPPTTGGATAAVQTTPLYNKVTPLVQRQATEEEEMVQTKRAIQRQEAEEEEMLQTSLQRQEEEEEMQMKTVAQRQEEEEEEMIQAQEEEEEAIQTSIQRQEEEEEMQMKTVAQRQEEEEEMIQAQEEEEEAIQASLKRQEEEEEEMVQRKTASNKPLNLSRRLKSLSGQGQPLEKGVRSRMERGFGADFSNVRIHTGGSAEEMSESINAQAFTVGKDVFFNKDKFKPDAPEGDHLIAHELTHTIQQGAVSPLSNGKASESEPAKQETTGDATTATADTDLPVETDVAVPETPETTEPLAEGEEAPAIGADAQEAEPVPDYPRTPEEHPAFQQAEQQLDQTSKAQQSHEPSEQASSKAQAAAPSPGNERLSQAQAGQVEEMNQGAENKGEFDAEVFKSLLLEQIARILPTNEDEADEFADHNEMGSVKEAASNQAAAEKEKAAGSIQSTTEKEPDENAMPEREITPLEPQDAGAHPGGIGASEAMPPVRSDAEVSQPLQQNMQGVNDAMAEEEVTDEQLAKSNEPEFLTAREATHEAQEHTTAAPQTFRQQEQETLTNAQDSASGDSALTLAGMHGSREDLLNEVEGEQGKTMEADSAERTQVANDINAIFEQTKADVESILESLDTEVADSFDAGAESARADFEGFVERKMRKYKDDRYGGITGFARRVGDVFTGLPDEVNAFFVEGRERYINTMDGVLTGIAENVANKLNEAQLRIETGRQEVADYVASLPEELQSIGQEQAEQIQSKFDELESDVKNKQNQLVNDLANRYKESLEAVDARIEEMKEANKGLIDKALDLVGKVIAVIREIKNTIMGLISGAIAAVKAIIADPIGFLGNLISGIKEGIQRFLGNIWTNLLEGFLAWLTGALGPVGITVPENLFSFEGVLDLIRQVLGLTYSFIREQAVKVFGEEVVSAIETTFEILVIFLRDGFMGVVEYIKDKLADLKAMVIDTIMNMVITEVIEAGIKWVLGLLSPASAFVKAALTIIDIVKFFIQKGRQLFALVEAIVNGIREIAAGNVAKIAQFVEDALKRMLPLAIGFLASLLGIGDLVEKVQGLIQTVREKIAKAITSVFEGIKSLAMKLFNKLTGKKDDDEEPEETEKAEGDEELEDSEVGEVVTFSADGEGHKLWINTSGPGVEVMIASESISVGDKLEDWEGKVDTLDEEKQGEASSLISQGKSQYQATLQSGNVAEQEMEQAFSSDDVAEIQQAETADEAVEADQQTLKGTLKKLFEIFGEVDPAILEALLALKGTFEDEEGETHTLKFEGENGTIDLFVFSNRNRFFDYVKSKIFGQDTQDADTATTLGNDALTKAREATEAVVSAVSATFNAIIEALKDLIFGNKEKRLQAALDAIDQEQQKYVVDGGILKEDVLRVIATIKEQHKILLVLELHNGDDTWDYKYQVKDDPEAIKTGLPKRFPEVPARNVTPPFNDNDNNITSSLSINYAYQPHGDTGSEPGDQRLAGAWDRLESLGLAGSGRTNWVRFHLFNENIGGPGIASNLIPTRTAENNDYKSQFERVNNGLVPTYESKDEDGQYHVIWFEARASHGHSTPNNMFPSQYEAWFGIMEYENGNWARSSEELGRWSRGSLAEPIPPPDRVTLRVNHLPSRNADLSAAVKETPITVSLGKFIRALPSIADKQQIIDAINASSENQRQKDNWISMVNDADLDFS